MPDMDIKDLRPWIDRLWQDVGSHNSFAGVTLRVCRILLRVGPT